MRSRSLLLVLALGVVLVAGGAAAAIGFVGLRNGSRPASVVTPTPAVTSSPFAGESPSPARPATMSTVQARALVDRLVDQEQGNWHECAPLSSCPLTPRLATQLQDNSQRAYGAPPVLRQQYFVGPAQVMSIGTPAFNGQGQSQVAIRIQLDKGTPLAPIVRYDLTAVGAGADWLFDDISCAGRPETSAYQPPGPGWTCEVS